MSEAYQEMPNAAPLDERAASIPGHVERIMLRDYAPVNEGFHILYDAVELLRRNADAVTTLRDENERMREALKPFAEIADRADQGWTSGNEYGDHSMIAPPIRTGHFRAARAALKEKQK